MSMSLVVKCGLAGAQSPAQSSHILDPSTRHHSVTRSLHFNYVGALYLVISGHPVFVDWNVFGVQ